jgi:hypothetical protein
MKISETGQRVFDQSWADKIFSEFDPDKMSTPFLNHRDGYYFIMNGQHSINAAWRWLGKMADDTASLQCWVTEGLTEQQEAEMFLSLNTQKNVPTFQKFRVALSAGRAAETEVHKIVKHEKLIISEQDLPGAIGAVGTLLKVYKRHGPDTLGKALRLARDSFGDAGLKAQVIDGLALLCHRYNGVLDERSSIEALSNVHGGVHGLLGNAEKLRHKTGSSKPQCIAAQCVDTINRGRAAKQKLVGWFKLEERPKDEVQ